MTLPYSASIPAPYAEKRQECLRAGAAMMNLLQLDLKPRDIVTRQSFLNAIVVTMLLCGSTNAVLHMLAMARAAKVELDIDDFNTIQAKDRKSVV